jgi:hypothetical protein
LNYFKGKQDPVALADEEYPQWLWQCLDFSAKKSSEGDDSAGDEFCNSALFSFLVSLSPPLSTVHYGLASSYNTF